MCVCVCVLVCVFVYVWYSDAGYRFADELRTPPLHLLLSPPASLPPPPPRVISPETAMSSSFTPLLLLPLPLSLPHSLFLASPLLSFSTPHSFSRNPPTLQLFHAFIFLFIFHHFFFKSRVVSTLSLHLFITVSRHHSLCLYLSYPHPLPPPPLLPLLLYLLLSYNDHTLSAVCFNHDSHSLFSTPSLPCIIFLSFFLPSPLFLASPELPERL